MLKKLASIPDKIYRISSMERVIPIGTNYEENRKTIKSKGAYFELKSNQKKTSTINVECIDNNPITDIRLVSGNSVQINGEYDIYVDNDFISDVAFNSLANKSGKLKGSYIFVRLTDKLRLTRVDGPLYNQILTSQSRRSAAKVKKKDFKKGGVYLTPSGVCAIYLGSINTEYPIYGIKKYDTHPVKNRMLFLSCDKNNPHFDWENVTPYSLDAKKTHSFIEMKEMLKIPDNIINTIRDRMVVEFKQEILEYTTSDRGGYWLHYKFFRYCPLINMSEAGYERAKKFDINKYIAYA